MAKQRQVGTLGPLEVFISRVLGPRPASLKPAPFQDMKRQQRRQKARERRESKVGLRSWPTPCFA